MKIYNFTNYYAIPREGFRTENIHDFFRVGTNIKHDLKAIGSLVVFLELNGQLFEKSGFSINTLKAFYNFAVGMTNFGKPLCGVETKNLIKYIYTLQNNTIPSRLINVTGFRTYQKLYAPGKHFSFASTGLDKKDVEKALDQAWDNVIESTYNLARIRDEYYDFDPDENNSVLNEAIRILHKRK